MYCHAANTKGKTAAAIVDIMMTDESGAALELAPSDAAGTINKSITANGGPAFPTYDPETIQLYYPVTDPSAPGVTGVSLGGLTVTPTKIPNHVFEFRAPIKQAAQGSGFTISSTSQSVTKPKPDDDGAYS